MFRKVMNRSSPLGASIPPELPGRTIPIRQPVARITPPARKIRCGANESIGPDVPIVCSDETKITSSFGLFLTLNCGDVASLSSVCRIFQNLDCGDVTPLSFVSDFSVECGGSTPLSFFVSLEKKESGVEPPHSKLKTENRKTKESGVTSPHSKVILVKLLTLTYLTPMQSTP